MHEPPSTIFRCLIAFLTVFILASPIAKADAGKPSFTGHYELADAKADWTFSLDLTQTDSKATISFSAANNDGSGAAPDGDGKGTIDAKGVLSFTFTDSFDDAGTGMLTHAKDGWHLSLNPTKVAESRTLRFYGDMLLKRTSNKPQPQ